MRCCWFFFFFMCVVTFVQIRLRQQRDALKFPKKFAVNYRIEQNNISMRETSTMIIVGERMLYGAPPVDIRNGSFSSYKAVQINCYVTVKALPASFHTFSIQTKDETLKSVTVITNNEGVASTFLNHKFYYLNPTFFVTHRYDGDIRHDNEGSAISFGIVEISNLPIVVDKSLGFDYVKL